MTVANQTVRLYRANSAAVAVTVTQADGTPYAGAGVFRWRVALSPYALESEALVRKMSGDGIAFADGVATITLTSADTDLYPGLYYHELRVWDGSDVATVMTGAFVVKRSLQMGDNAAPAAASISLSGEMPVVA